MRALLSFQVVRFVLVGLLNTVFGYLLYAALLAAGLEFRLASFGALLLGILFSFRTQGTLVFRNRNPRLIFRFAACWLLIYAANIASIQLLMKYGFGAYEAGAITVPMIAVLSYVVQKRLVFSARDNQCHE